MSLLPLRNGLALVLVLASSVWAQGPESGENPPAGPGGTPPPSAIDACSNKTENSFCKFSGRGGSDTGLCVYTSDKQYFACDPHAGEQRPGPDEGQKPSNGQESADRSNEMDNNGSSGRSSAERGVTRFPSPLFSTSDSTSE